MLDQMKVPHQYELTHMQIQAIMRDNPIPEDQMKYLGEREYTTEYKAHPEYHGVVMPWYLIGGDHEVPVCDIGSIDRVDEDDCVPENDGWGPSQENTNE